MTTAAKKIAPCNYEYKGFTIRKNEHVCGGHYWFMEPDWDTKAPNNIDPAKTLKEAKEIIDTYVK